VQQYDSGICPAFDVMEADAVDREEFALRRIPAFSPSRQGVIDQAHRPPTPLLHRPKPDLASLRVGVVFAPYPTAVERAWSC
jgi:hypothetical protein